MNTAEKVSFLLLRLSIGWLFFYAGWSKVVTFFTDAKDWTAAGFLSQIPGPFAGLFSGMAGSALVDYLNAYGLLLVGAALILGVLVRWSAFWGVALMVLYYLASFPAEHAYIVEDHFIYALVLVVLAAVGAGRAWGVDRALENSGFVKSNSWLVKLLG